MHRLIFGLSAALVLVTGSIPVSASTPPEPTPATPATELAVCFAPGTSPAYIDHVNRRVISFGEPMLGIDAPTKHQLVTRWSTTANGGGLGQGDPTVLTWSYVPDGTSIGGSVGEPTSDSNLQAWLNGLYPGGFAEWHALFVEVFTRWGDLTGITYVYEPNDDGATFPQTSGGPFQPGAPGVVGVRGDVRIAGHFIDGDSGILGYNFFPNTGDMVLDSADSFYNNMSSNSLGLRNVLSHEHGHGLGLQHVCPVDDSKLMEPFLSFAFDGPQHDDTLGGNRGYGDFLEHNDSPGTAIDLGPWNLSLTELSLDAVGDEDFFSFTVNSASSVELTVEPNGLTYLEDPQNPDGSCPAGTPYNTLTRRDLALELRDVDGTTVLATADANGLGGTETLQEALPAAGTYFVRVFSDDGIDLAQLYDLTVSTGEQIFADGFESGDTSAWTLTVP